MSELCQFPPSANYTARAQAVTEQGYAIWDVLFDCTRAGSADSKIERASEKPNNFSGFLEKHSTIKLIAFNGNAARQIFMRHCGHIFTDAPDLEFCQLPSTSPAYAAMRPEQKLDLWRNQLIAK